MKAFFNQISQKRIAESIFAGMGTRFALAAAYVAGLAAIANQSWSPGNPKTLYNPLYTLLQICCLTMQPGLLWLEVVHFCGQSLVPLQKLPGWLVGHPDRSLY